MSLNMRYSFPGLFFLICAGNALIEAFANTKKDFLHTKQFLNERVNHLHCLNDSGLNGCAQTHLHFGVIFTIVKWDWFATDQQDLTCTGSHASGKAKHLHRVHAMGIQLDSPSL